MFFRTHMSPIVLASANPAVHAWTLWVNADDYVAATPTTPGIASAGTSGSNPLQDATFSGGYKPSKGSGLNGHNYYDSTADYFRWLDQGTGKTVADFWDANALSLAIFGTIEDSDTNDANAANNRGFGMGGYGGFGGFAVKKNLGILTAQAFVYDVGASTNKIDLTVTASTSYLFQMTMFGGTLWARLNRGSWSSVSSGNIASTSGMFSMCGSGSAKSKIQSMWTGKGNAKTDFDTVASYCEARYGVTL